MLDSFLKTNYILGMKNLIKPTTNSIFDFTKTYEQYKRNATTEKKT